jgi:4-hydroxy-3-methylbut-2-enyl diphosphate reductase
VGSKNSSNSQRLREIAAERGVPAYLVDGPADIDLRWFEGVETVLLTSGASAPESLVQQCVELLQMRFGAEVETRSLREEQVRFPLPRPLRELEGKR